MNPRLFLGRSLSALGVLASVSLLAFSPAQLLAESKGKATTGKIYVAGTEGGAQVATGEKIEALAIKSVFMAQGAQIETMAQGTLTMVFSNGTGALLYPDTHLEVRGFNQEPFIASRTDMEIEPSISHTVVFLSRGAFAVSTSKLAAGSTFTLLTWLGSFNLHGGNLVVESDSLGVKFSLLAGEGTVQGGELDLGGHVLHAGEQAGILPGAPGQPNIVRIRKIPAADLSALEAAAAQAYAARKTVFFEQDATGEITAAPVVPVSLPVQATVSPSQLPR